MGENRWWEEVLAPVVVEGADPAAAASSSTAPVGGTKRLRAHPHTPVGPRSRKLGDLGDDDILGRGGSAPASSPFFLHHLRDDGISAMKVAQRQWLDGGTTSNTSVGKICVNVLDAILEF
ncbi:hypothetical protein E2562_027618 [Oryza meyeriana var. granulata]|uniref:Uncharacterized protein n=1 Tax=Oryza meyeriana var. granulata TaxID=110450 RepID=A0A6G1E2S8_9ORYZ|nr:hypothetical protein E2562_027618 [Oryza meyeriana var. granulata]